MHKCNTVAGMSGAPLLDGQARVIGLHEGKIEEPQGILRFNRATMLANIVTAVEVARRHRPLVTLHFDSAQCRRQWAQYGLQDETAEVQSIWRDALAATGVDDQGVSLQDPADNYYPMLPFKVLTDWMATEADAVKQSVLVVAGNSGCGKTFALHAASAQAGMNAIVAVSADVSSGLALSEMLPQLYPAGNFSDPWRSFDGRMRNTYITSVLDHFETKAAENGTGQVLIVVDLDPSGAYWAESSEFWLQFSVVCAQRQRLRLLLSGPSEELQDQLTIAGFRCVQPPLLEPQSVQQFCDGLARQLGKDGSAKQAGERAIALYVAAGRPGKISERLAMADAARIILQVRSELLGGGVA